MAATRKLQGEIDRCLKKVAEGVETFEDIWKKVHNATNTNQKQKHLQEKYEADLKKEIKKLQRLRDQIKSWIASAEIKDKSALLENRRLIETQMERFKVVERETKTKAYSKEGLGAAQKMDPAQRIKDDARNWLTSSISSLQIQIDQYESEIESLLAGKKKRLDRDKQERMDDLRGKLDRHKFHITKLETLLRLLDNDGVEAEQVNKIKDDVEYYIDSSQEPDFEENEFIYDDIIGLDEVELSGTATTDSNNSNETSGSPSSVNSGGSPSQSPVTVQQVLTSSAQAAASSGSSAASAALFQQQQAATQAQSNGNNIGYASDTSAASSSATTSTDPSGSVPVAQFSGGSGSDKRNKSSESNANIKLKQQPLQLIKPTPVRATAKMPSSSDIQINKIVSSTPSKIQQQQATTTAVLATSSLPQSSTSMSGAGNNANEGTGAPAAPATNSGHNPAVQQHAPTPGICSSASIPAGTTATAASSPASSANTNSGNVQGLSVIHASPPIAFAAVAKHNTSLLENGSVLQQQQQQPAAPTVAAIVGAGAQAQQQQLTQLSNLQTNSSHLHNGLQVSSVGTSDNNSNVADATISLKTMAQEAINRSTIDVNSVIQQQPSNVDTRQPLSLSHQPQPKSILQQHFISENTANLQQQQQKVAAQQQQQQNAVAVNAAAIGSIAVAGSHASTNSNGPIATSTGIMTLANAAGQQTSGNAKVLTLQQHQQQQQMATTEAHIPTLLGVTPLGPTPLQKEHQIQFQMMEAAYYHLPQPMDTEKLQTYFHRAPVPTPAHYPQSQLPIYDTVEFYQRLSTETLFFVFYYMEGSKAQYLAAKALKKQSWRFHTKYMMWFQRHEEPKIINDDYEQGTYIYFDYEKWSQRKKEGFTFEYKYLEDKELN
ncbi:CCR4-NOT transcription complex subunit 3 [Drosophila serrata]|uniref:CCR4-NOT transcription complex subunit 3 n=1 Tax=Drosophila serrata TaxID=7274 RepID=UPI000A1D05B5|nr:CCR4-NOT transcription complex subunit 3 [Drosophila serrata]XP_020798614.1 CCR4-NOT transcription complex subunit 3 [Drosophila serrata]XP_020798615.1 CCR4-NOT transcription complex subunit 3 [Drosophila serrata]XP_020798616.1 CCR4-NOT transcription complex subunit 3 [Drosophila serrata]